MPTARMTTKGQLTIPKSVRDSLGLKAGDEIDFTVEGRSEARLRARNLDIRALKTALPPPRRRIPPAELDRAIDELWGARILRQAASEADGSVPRKRPGKTPR